MYPFKDIKLEKPAKVASSFNIITVCESMKVKKEYYFGLFEESPKNENDKILFWCYEEELAKAVIESFQKQTSESTSKLQR